VVLDAATFEKLHIMYPPQVGIEWHCIVFSPDSHLLSGYSWSCCIVSWDLQTGGLLSNINTSEWGDCSSMSYSVCGKMVGGLFDSTVIICNVLSGTCMSSHSIQQPIAKAIWTQGEYLQFATVESGSITIQQVSFTSNQGPTMVCSLPAPKHFSTLVLLPTLLWIAFTHNLQVIVWDARNEEILLETTDIYIPRAISFSPDGHFLVCGTVGREFYIWKKSPAGYLSYKKFVSGADLAVPSISPNGKSVITTCGNMIQLWYTEDSPGPLSSVSMQVSKHSGFFCIEFSPDESLVAITERLSTTVTVLDTESGNPLLVIDTGTKTCGLRITGDKVIVVCDGKIVTWDLPARDCESNTRQNINDSIQTTSFKHLLPIHELYASISPNLKFVAFMSERTGNNNLHVYNMHTGKGLAEGMGLAEGKACEQVLGFSSSSCEVWSTGYDGIVYPLEIAKGDGPNAIKLKQLRMVQQPQSDFPWCSPCGYQVTHDGWILSPSGKLLLWLPRHLQQDYITQRKWNKRFLVIWNQNMPEPCILKLEV
jgi:WD40 repeat protein